MKTFHNICILCGSILLLFLVWKTGLADLWDKLAFLGWGLAPLILIEGVADIFHTMGWRFCLSDAHRAMPFERLFRIRMAGYSVNYLTPTATLGGEVTKGALLSEDRRGIEAATGVIIGKLSFALSQLLFVSCGSLIVLWQVNLPDGFWPAMLIGSALLGCGIIGFLLIQKHGQLGILVRWLSVRNIGGKQLQKLAKHITRIDNDLKCFYLQRPWDLPISVFWHCIGFGCGLIQTWWFLIFFQTDASFIVASGIWLLGSWFDLLTFAVPLGIGVQEGTRIIAFNAVGFTSLMGLTYSIMLRLEQIFWACIGMLCYASLVKVKRKPDNAMNMHNLKQR